LDIGQGTSKCTSQEKLIGKELERKLYATDEADISN